MLTIFRLASILIFDSYVLIVQRAMINNLIHQTFALILVYNHVFMALPVESQHTEALFSEILRFLWTKQVDGQTTQKRRLVARKCITAGLEMGGLGIPHPDEIIQWFRQNLLQKI